MVVRHIEHVVLLKLKPLTGVEWSNLHGKFEELCKIIPGIKEFSFGPNFKYDNMNGKKDVGRNNAHNNTILL